MESPFRIRIVPCDNGERFPMIVNRKDGMPLFYPCVYIDAECRGNGDQDATMEAKARAIKFLYDWGIRHNIDIEYRLKAGNFLDIHEVDILVQEAYLPVKSLLSQIYTGEEQKKVPLPRSKVSNLVDYRKAASKKGTIVQNDTAGNRLRAIRGYLEWLANIRVGKESKPSVQKTSLVFARDDMLRFIESKLPSRSEVSDLHRRMGVTPAERDRILEVIDPESSENPWKDAHVKIRNQLFITMLYLLGIRRGEALGIRVSDINFQNNSLTIHRTPEDAQDPRKYKPNTKTKARVLKLNTTLARLCRDYVFKYRRSKDLRATDIYPYLFVESKNGNPLTNTTANEIFATLRRKVPGIPANFSPHVLRHTWNDEFSRKADENIRTGKWTVDDEKEIRITQMGWKLHSKMASVYSRRHIKQKADEAFLELQDELIRRKDD